MNKDIIKELDIDLLIELHQDLRKYLKQQRQSWLDNEKNRTEHLNSLILETREELEYVEQQIEARNIK